MAYTFINNARDIAQENEIKSYYALIDFLVAKRMIEEQKYEEAIEFFNKSLNYSKLMLMKPIQLAALFGITKCLIVLDKIKNSKTQLKIISKLIKEQENAFISPTLKESYLSLIKSKMQIV